MLYTKMQGLHTSKDKISSILIKEKEKSSHAIVSLTGKVEAKKNTIMHETS